MAKVLLIFEDGEHDELTVKIDFGDGVKPTDTTTLAQAWAMRCVQWVGRQGKASLISAEGFEEDDG